MTRYEIVITVMLDAENASDAGLIAEQLIVTDSSHEENDIDYVVSEAIEI